jgi:hypothetical protein
MSRPFAERDESVLNDGYFRERKAIELANAEHKARSYSRSYTPGTMSDISTVPSTPLDSLFGTRAGTPRDSCSTTSSQTDISEHELPKSVTIPEEDREKIEVIACNFMILVSSH